MYLLGGHGMALSFDAGGDRQENYWVGDFAEEEAMEFLTFHGHGDKAKEFLDACTLAMPCHS